MLRIGASKEDTATLQPSGMEGKVQGMIKGCSSSCCYQGPCMLPGEQGTLASQPMVGPVTVLAGHQTWELGSHSGYN